VGKKNKIKKKKSPNKTTLSAKEEEILSGILKNPENITPDNIKDYITSSEMAIGLVERLPIEDPGTIDLLYMVEDAFDEKNVLKAVKKTLFKLKQKGIKIPFRNKPQSTFFPPKKQETESPKVYISSIDAEGGQSILFMIPHIYKGVEVGIGVVNYNSGIEYFIYNHCGKKRSKEIKKYFIEQNRRVVETSMPHAATILENAYKRDELKAGESVADYLKLRPWLLENITLRDESIIYDFMSKQEMSEVDVTESRIENLFEHELMESWIINPDDIKPVLDDILKVDDSPIIISGDQKIDRVNEIKKKALSALYPETKRLILKDILEETAYIFYKLEEEEYGRICVAAAREVRESSSGRDLFLMYLLERSLGLYMSLEEDSDSDVINTDPSPTIITP
jgi:hypothetical protein